MDRRLATPDKQMSGGFFFNVVESVSRCLSLFLHLVSIFDSSHTASRWSLCHVVLSVFQTPLLALYFMMSSPARGACESSS